MKELSFRQWHHGYLGLLLIGGGLLELKHHRSAGIIFLVVGIVVLIDDVVEHAIQYFTQTEWYSPLRRLYGWFYARIGWLRSINRWLDDVFHRL